MGRTLSLRRDVSCQHLHCNVTERKYYVNLNGLLIGVSCFILIGLFHPIVIYTEYRFGKQLWPIFAVFGSTCITISFFLKDDTVSAIVSILGFCLLWSIKELFEQEKRVQKGWYPKNPKKR